MFSPSGGLWLAHRFFLPFYLTNTTNTLYYKHGGQNGFYLYTHCFCKYGNNILHHLKSDWGYQMKNEKLWLLIDGVHRKLLRARYWTTSLDDYKQDIEDAIKSLEVTKKKLESEK